ncbi:OmpA family protein [Archangium violaceum]|uniref:thrombospondin type 3 repeat-containing protein n=1 Tax=Archangium violaceum TaxID=83451 RepID=UPI002B29F8C7|nr:OmpA family protein [Archangium gephyra]
MLGPVALALFLLLPGMVTFAQTPLPGFELERLELNPGTEGSLVVGTGELLTAGQFRISAIAHYSHRPLMLLVDNVTYEVVGGRTTTHVAAAYALTNWLELGVQLPLVAAQWGQDLSSEGLLRPASFGISTPLAGVRLGLLTQESQGLLDLAVGGDVGFPVGNPEGFGRDAGLRYLPRVMVGRRFGFIRAALDVGVLLRPRVAGISPLGTGGADQLDNEVRIGAAVMTTGRRLRWEFNARGSLSLARNQPAAAELLPGVRYLVNPSLEVFALAGVGLGTAPGTPLFRFLAGGSFGDVTPRRGPGESSVRCDLGLALSPEECPDGDFDGDGVRNLEDKCPTIPGDSARAGCSRTDTDKDGIEDTLDACPTEPGDAARQGCPVSDQDKDGVEDSLDSCPAEAGPADNRGCPVKDKDKDGIENDQDECPDEPGPLERRGCPEEDSDKDGVPNRIDTCANERGVATNMGCPEHEEPLVEITHKELKLSGKVVFEASRARLQSRSFVLLDWVAKVMREHPEIPVVVVGAHTDDRGLSEENRRLSQQRAEEVRRYLIGKGVAAERLVPKGYGQDRPEYSNATSFGRENNRRVDFKIIRNSDENPESPQR